MHRLFALPLLAMLLLFPLPSRHPTPRVLVHVSILGDSLSEGYGSQSPSTDAFPHKLALPGYVLDVATFAHGGYTVAQMMPAVPALLATHPAVVVIELGTNDQRWYHSLAQFRSDYAALLAALHHVPHVVCLGIWPSPGHADIGDYDAVIYHLCGAAAYVDISRFVTPRYMNAANWHPNTAGAAAIAAQVSVVIKRML